MPFKSPRADVVFRCSPDTNLRTLPAAELHAIHQGGVLRRSNEIYRLRLDDSTRVWVNAGTGKVDPTIDTDLQASRDRWKTVIAVSGLQDPKRCERSGHRADARKLASLHVVLDKKCGVVLIDGNAYAVDIGAEGSVASATVTRIDMSRSRAIRFWQSIVDLFRRKPITTRADVIRAMLDFKNANFISADLHGAHLRGADLRGANLRGANLRGADLRGADLRGADLGGADLGGADLSGANLSGACGEANFERANLERANLQEAQLQKAVFAKANLEGSKLQEANLEEADFQQANLTCADLQGANLKSVIFSESKLVRACLRRANLEDTNLGHANFANADLADAKLDRAFLYKANFAGANLSGAKLGGNNEPWSDGGRGTEADFRGASLIGATLSGRNLKESHFGYADLTGANLSRCDLTSANLTKAVLMSADLPSVKLANTDLADANLTNANMNYATLSTTKVKGARFSGATLHKVRLRRGDCLVAMDLAGVPPFAVNLDDLWQRFDRNRLLDHLNNNGRSYLTNVNAIKDEQRKIGLMRQVIDQLNEINSVIEDDGVEDIYPAVLGLLSHHPIYCARDDVIRKFADRCRVHVTQPFNERPLPTTLNPDALRFHIDVVTAQMKADPAFAAQHAVAIMQLSFRAAQSGEEKMQKIGKQLRADYLETFPESQRAGVERAIDLTFEEMLFPLPQPEPTLPILMDPNYFRGLVLGERVMSEDPRFGEIPMAWTNLQGLQAVTENGETKIQPDSVTDLRAAFAPFPWLLRAYFLANNDEMMRKYLATLNLGDEFGALFQACLNSAGSERELTGDADQWALGNVFGPLLDAKGQVTVITAAHADEVFAVFDGIREPKSKAFLLWTLSTIMTKLSSADYFGTDGQSPNPLRTYASGLLNMAHGLDPLAMGIEMNVYYQDQLLGNNCTQVLSSLMKKNLSDAMRNDAALEEIFHRAWPKAWT